MKNRYIKYFIVTVFGLAITFNACTDLEETVYSELIAEQFNPSEEDVMAVIGPVYSNLRDFMWGWHGFFCCQEECSDIIVTPVRPNGWDDGGVYRRMHKHIWTALQSHTNGLWARAYSGITNANRAIYQIESGNLPISQGKENYLAELKVARAFYYYILCDNFGNVPIVTRFDVEEGFLPEQSTRQQVYDFIVGEITGNLSLLSNDVDQSTYARFNLWAAKTLLAKIYLNAEVYTGKAEWDNCITQCNDIINSGAYNLEPVFSDIFKTENENSTEIIFAIPYDEIYTAGWPVFYIHLKTLHPASQATYNLEVSPWGGNCAIPQFIDTYDDDDSRLESTWIMGLQFASNGDTLRCNLSPEMMGKPLEYVNILQSVDLSGEHEGYRIGKYEFKMGALSGLSNDVPFFRYADVLMMKAECLLRKGDADAAAALVTQVRGRAFIDNPGKSTVTGAELQAGSSYNYGFYESGVVTEPEGGGDIQYGRFLDELGWEFAAEARRRQDLIRFGVFTTKMWLSHRPNGDYRTIFAIPEAQINTNPNLTQNPGY